MPSITITHTVFQLQYHEADMYYSDALTFTNYIFTLLFLLECILKMMALGCKV